MKTIEDILKRVKASSKELALIDDEKKNSLLEKLSKEVIKNKELLLQANQKDLLHMDKASPLYDRLKLTDSRLQAIAEDIRHVASLPSPLGRTLKESTLANGLHIKRVSVPFGVIGVVYEARPNVSFDVFSLCFKSGNASVLKGGKDAKDTNEEIIRLIHSVLKEHNISESVVELLPATHEATQELLSAQDYVDLCIPRGGKSLIDFVRNTAKIPVIETGAGVVNTFFDKYGDKEMGKTIINNAKTRRVSVCNALDCLIVHSKRLEDIPLLCSLLKESNVIIYADSRAYEVLKESYPNNLLRHATKESYGTEFMDYIMALRVVDTFEEALQHIDMFSSGHSECIITQDEQRAKKFQASVDAACVYWNAPVSFTDGAQFGLGAEIGISTQKLGARGPMGLEEITTYKWIIEGQGQIRKP